MYEPVKLAGTLVNNLQWALASAKRLRGQTVYPETVDHWRDLVGHARERLVAGDPSERAAVHSLCQRLAAEIELREIARGRQRISGASGLNARDALRGAGPV